MARKQKLIHLHGKDRYVGINQVAIELGEIVVTHADKAVDTELAVLSNADEVVYFPSLAKVASDIAKAEKKAKDYADTLDTAMDGRVDALETTVTELTGDGENSVAKQIEAALKDANDYTDTAKANLQAQIGKAATEADGPTGLHKEIADVKDAYKAAIEAMDATKTGEGTFVDVTVKQENGVITEVTVAESDIASAQALANEVSARTNADDAIKGRLDVIEGEAAGSIKKAVADAKAELLGEVADTDAKTLAALNDRIDSVVTDAKTYSIAKATTEEVTSLGTNVKEAYKLVDEDNKKVGEFIPVYKDSALQEVKLVEQELQFTYLLANGETSTVGVDVSKFLAESEFANGLQVIDHVVSVKVDAASEEFLTVGADGIKLAGVQDAIDTVNNALDARLDVIEGEAEGSIKKAVADAKAALLGDAAEDYNTLGKLEDKVIAAAAAANTYTDNKIAAEVTRSNKYADDAVAVEVADREAAISGVTTAYKAADDVVRGEFAAADTKIREDFAAADTKIREDFAAADTKIRGEFAAADTKLSDRITVIENAKPIDTVTVDNTATNKITATKTDNAVALNFDNMVIDCGTY